ncbi:odorant binding protein 3 precursor [Apis mellifera caucasica]|uniref:OBP3 n=1 Tax=Apis mellifera TaxID=7460 RepID=Q1W647_APIME|nr:odorant binding protein 3 precursor [Apis mellifera]XP_006567395.1 odorant binding protein 3 isoform X1 [Apis mellifera]XP_006567396.1 odorant binding protein 3 isoform X1 [Apis mellifera]XP_026298408.1 odorant binding protein 3 isoform X1 [Apis mellifera]KAG6801067.1 odorant binding protein 3 precursor [Apis mellifera caucasica]KAG9430900.1 odorant binding protein 3 precursor [Apis mellifera carnica]ABD92639.1 OBP3 [Apis mellifera]|eukprot:NP_001035311.1 odorant binding protein 3 precursor [Apis mellifera]
MKTIVILLFTLCIVSYMMVRCDDITLCLKQENLNLDDIDSLLEDESERMLRKRGCIEACLFHRLALMNDNVFDVSKFDVYLNDTDMDMDLKDSIRKIIRQCVDNAKNEDKCLTAQKFSRCVIDYVKFHITQYMISNANSNTTSEEESSDNST